MCVYYQSRECCYQNSVFSILIIPVQTPYLLFTHSHITYSVCFHNGQYICFNSIYHPQEQWLEVQLQQTTFTVAKNIRLWGNWGGGVAWKRTCRLDDKCICPEGDSRTSGCAYYEQLYCPYWGCERWTTWLKGEVHTSHGTAAAVLQKREATPNCTLGACNPVNFTIFNLNETGWEVGKKFDILICEKETDSSTHHDHL
jgi:hypothetical protein